uniref:ATP-binding cassette, sub-family G (WHITE), member 2d n=1 Tax=Cyprinus carpio TaxID=7962 RepID=A0A8C2IQK1_CYPCA
MTDNAVFEHDQITEETGRNGMSGSNIIGMELMKKQHGATVSFHSIHYRVEQKSGHICRRTTVHKEILLDLNGIMRPGLNAILGPTESDKSLFLDVLAARKDPAGLSGEVLINGALQPPNFKLCNLKRLHYLQHLCVCVKDDIVMGTLTVRENFSFSAALRLSCQISPREKEARVNHLISELGLNKVADSKVKQYFSSRLSIFKSVYFYWLKELNCEVSKRCVFNTNISKLNGVCFSNDNIGFACEAHNNPADFFLDVINGSSAAVNMTKIQNNGDFEFEVAAVSQQSIEDQLVEKYKNCSYARGIKAELERITWAKDNNIRAKCHTITYNSSFFHQPRWVSWRTFWNLMLNPQTSVAQLAVTALMAAIVGAIFYGVKDDQSGIQNRFGVLFFITTNQCFSTLSAAELFITERKLFIHEYTSGYYRVSVYFLSKILSDIITQCTIPSILFTCVVYFMIGLKPTAAAFFIFMLTVILVSCAAVSMTMAISADQSVVAVANIFMTISFIFMMIFFGLLVNLKSTMDWLSWLKYLSIPRYGLEALEINEFVGLKFCGNVSTVMSRPAADVLIYVKYITELRGVKKMCF